MHSGRYTRLHRPKPWACSRKKAPKIVPSRPSPQPTRRVMTTGRFQVCEQKSSASTNQPGELRIIWYHFYFMPNRYAGRELGWRWFGRRLMFDCTLVSGGESDAHRWGGARIPIIRSIELALEQEWFALARANCLRTGHCTSAIDSDDARLHSVPIRMVIFYAPCGKKRI